MYHFVATVMKQSTAAVVNTNVVQIVFSIHCINSESSFIAKIQNDIVHLCVGVCKSSCVVSSCKTNINAVLNGYIINIRV